MNKGFKYIIGFLVLLALVLGYKIQQKQSASTYSPLPEAPRAEGNQAKEPPSLPVSGATEQASQAKLVEGTPVETNTLDITSCLPSPKVISIKEGSDLTLVNKDAAPHAILFNKDQVFPVGANSSKTIKASFGNGAGNYGYGCDGSKEAVGLMILTK